MTRNTNPSLKLLTTTREARRESAMAKLAAARRACELAEAACQQAQNETQQAWAWREEVLARCALGEGGMLRETLIPTCDALLAQRRQHLVLMQAAWRAAHEEVTLQRQHLTTCERDALRLEEWLQLQQAQARREQAAQENQQDDEQPLLQRRH